ncbi:MAG: DUF2799 domain-containing protein [Steroidobacterales bacterium]
MSKDECLATDWRTIGYEDGIAGYSGDHIAQHRKACAKYGVRTDLTLYQEGRAQGLREYCQPANGYRLGTQGASYRGVCPVELERDFVDAFEAGHELYGLQARVWDTEAQLNAKRQELDRVQHGIVANAAAAVSTDSNNQERADAVLDTATLAERSGRLEQEIRQLEVARARYERDLDDYRAHRAPMF